MRTAESQSKAMRQQIDSSPAPHDISRKLKQQQKATVRKPYKSMTGRLLDRVSESLLSIKQQLICQTTSSVCLTAACKSSALLHAHNLSIGRHAAVAYGICASSSMTKRAKVVATGNCPYHVRHFTSLVKQGKTAALLISFKLYITALNQNMHTQW